MPYKLLKTLEKWVCAISYATAMASHGMGVVVGALCRGDSWGTLKKEL
jgi:hypothetical protein